MDGSSQSFSYETLKEALKSHSILMSKIYICKQTDQTGSKLDVTQTRKWVDAETLMAKIRAQAASE